jgi:hypothetical protein
MGTPDPPAAVTTRRRGRPRTDTLGLVERVTAEWVADPTCSPDVIRDRVSARRRDVWRIVRCLRAAQAAGRVGSV